VKARRATSIALGLAVTLSLLVARPAQPAAAFSGIPLPTHSFGDVVADPGSSQVFMSSPFEGSILVFDLTGNLLKTITGETGAGRMLVVGSTLYVSLSTGAIDRIDTASDTETSPLVTGLTSPGDLGYANSLIWTTTGVAPTITLASVDPSAQTPVVTTYGGVFNVTNQLADCADFAVNHAPNPSYLVAFACSSWYTIERFDVSGATPTQTASVSPPSFVKDVVVSDDGTHVLATFSGEVDEYNMGLTLDGVVYPGAFSTTAVASTSMNGLKLVSGSDASLINNVFSYPMGDPAQPLVASSPGPIENRGITISPDGLTAYAIVYTLGQIPPNMWLDVIPLPALPNDGTPGAPTNVQATAGVGAAIVTWVAPAYHGTSLITAYKVSSSGGATATVNPSTFSALLAGLSPVAHTFTVQAMNASGLGLPSASNTVTPEGGGTYNTLQPSRILDTRNGNGGFPKRRVAANTAISLQVTGRGGVPGNMGVGAVVMNLTVTDTTGPGFVTAYPHGFARPLASSLNYIGGMTVPNLVQVAVGTGGKVDLYVGGASAHLVADIEGWYGDSTDSYGQGALYQSTSPGRIYDSRYVSTATGYAHQPLGPNQSITLNVGFQPYNTVAVLNVTATRPTQAGYLTVYPTGSPRPATSNVNFAAGQTVPNRVIVGLGNNGDVTITNGPGTVDVIVDDDGYFGQYGAPFVPVVPYRSFDTRTCHCKMPAHTIYNLVWTGPTVTGIAFNATVTSPTAAGNLTIYGDQGLGLNASIPSSSDLNFTAGETVANATPLGMYPSIPEGFDILNENGSTDVILDVDGIYGAPTGNLVTCPCVPTTTREPRAAVVGPRVSSVKIAPTT